jgi:hypothetical protein
MPLKLEPNPNSSPAERRTDQHVMSGRWQIGRIYMRKTVQDEPQWMWAINGVSVPPDVMRCAGIAGTFEEANTRLGENWQKWLAWANLQEISGPSPSPPPASNPDFPDSSA